MKYAPILFLLLIAPAQAGGWARTCPEDRAELRRIAQLTRLNCVELPAVIEQERACFNQQTMMQYNRMLSSPQPMMLTPEVAPTTSPRTFFPR